MSNEGSPPKEEEKELSEYDPVEILSGKLIEDSLSQLYRVPDGSSFAFSTLTCEEKEPPLVDLEDINRRSETFKSTPLEQYKNLRVLKLNINQLTSISKVESLEYLIEIQAKTNAITDVSFMTGALTNLPYL